MRALKPWQRRAGIAGAILAVLAILYTQFLGAAVVRFGGLFWIPVDSGTFWLPSSVSLALRDPPPTATAGTLDWREVRKGFEVAELPALADGVEVDRIFLARVDPAHFDFTIENDPSGSKHLDDWMDETGAALVVNGSYYSRTGEPATPTVVKGRLVGPSQYDAKHGAFIFKDAMAEIRDLETGDWRAALADTQMGMVSYPLLLAADGSTDRTPKGSGWLANRSFIGEDRSGRIVIGTTQGAFFALDRFAEFLKTSPLELKAALNLDGGPVACQGVRLNGFERKTYGQWELQVENGQAKALPPWILQSPPMPLVLTVVPKRAAGAN